MFSTKIEPIFIIDLTLCSNCQIYGEDFVNFCGLGKNYEINSSIVLRLGAQSSYVVKYFEGSNAVNAELDNNTLFFLVAHCCPL